MSTDTIQLPVVPKDAPLADAMHAGFKRRLAYPKPLPSTIVTPRRSRLVRHAVRLPQVRKSVGYKVVNALLWVVFVPVLPPVLAILVGPVVERLIP